MTPKIPSHLNPVAIAALVLALVLPLAVAPPVAAQAQGRIAGKVMDQEGNALEGVKITLWSPELNFEIDTETNKRGRFTLSVVDSTKPYMIRLEMDGFITVEEPADPPLGDVARKEWKLVPVGADGAAQGAVLDAKVEGKRAAVKAYNDAAGLYNAGDLDGAMAKFAEAVETDPEMIPAKEVLGALYIDRDRFEEALTLADDILAVEPENVKGLSMKYDALVGLDRSDGAGEVLDALFAAQPDAQTAVRLFNAGVSALRAEDNATAERRFSQAVEANPQLNQGYAALARIYVRQKNWEKALEKADTLIGLDPADVTGLSVRYDALLTMGREDEAKQAFEKLQTASPETVAEAFFKQGQEYFDAGENEAAIEAFEKVIAAKPEHARAHYRLGLAYISSGSNDKAKSHLQRFIELAPDDPESEVARQMMSYLD